VLWDRVRDLTPEWENLNPSDLKREYEIYLENNIDEAEYHDFDAHSKIDIPAPSELTKNQIAKLDSADIIASGYEFNCDDCQHVSNVIAVTEVVTCEGCGTHYRVDFPQHAIE